MPTHYGYMCSTQLIVLYNLGTQYEHMGTCAYSTRAHVPAAQEHMSTCAYKELECKHNFQTYSDQSYQNDSFSQKFVIVGNQQDGFLTFLSFFIFEQLMDYQKVGPELTFYQQCPLSPRSVC